MRKIVSFLSLLMLMSALAFSQPRTVTGTVTDENGAPVPFATISEAGTQNATTADTNGFSGQGNRLCILLYRNNNFKCYPC